ncbi:hypothetical protein ABN028_33230 [Actinopolymorpha sp. B17G11]|uniref:hypothetical protein n=1 Tax=Actinopolymorpha sp. B17G11 TaxID=3160861 RepID=UPI0032E4C2FE
MTDRTAAKPYTVRALDASTWDAFAELCDRNGGVMGGCWCQNNHCQPGTETPASGRIEAVSQVVAGRTVSGHWLASATVELFEQNGFERVRQVGKHAWIVSRVLDPA